MMHWSWSTQRQSTEWQFLENLFGWIANVFCTCVCLFSVWWQKHWCWELLVCAMENSFFTETMSRNFFHEILRFLHFDLRETRRAHLQVDKFALISEVWNGFVAMFSIACCNRSENITVDEQLFPTKAWCCFTQYKAKKPIKFWHQILAGSGCQLKIHRECFTPCGWRCNSPF